MKNLLGINMKVMIDSDMFAHKLCALLDRNAIANRDIFDTWFFMNKHTPVNKDKVEERMNMSFTRYIQACIDQLENMNNRGLLQGVGELMDDDTKQFVRTKLKTETIGLLKFYKEFPIIKKLKE